MACVLAAFKTNLFLKNLKLQTSSLQTTAPQLEQIPLHWAGSSSITQHSTLWKTGCS